MIDPNWTRWSYHSIVFHFSERLKEKAHIYVEGRVKANPEPLPRFEIRIDGPYIREVSRGLFYLDVEINILLLSSISSEDLYDHQGLAGLAASAFTDIIDVKRLGLDNSSLGCYQLRSNSIIVTNFGALQPTNTLLASSVEGHYRMCLKV